MGTPDPYRFHPTDEYILATPAERHVLFQVVFQTDELGLNRLHIANGAEGRRFRALLSSLGLLPIREAMQRFGRISSRLLTDGKPAVFQVPKDVLPFYREKIADLPRSAAQEATAGEFLDSLNGLESGPFYRPSVTSEQFSPWRPAEELWAPVIETTSDVLADLRVSAARVQAAMNDFEDETAALALPEPLLAAMGKFQEAILVEVNGALIRAAQER